MAEETVTIRAEMLTDVPQKAAESAAALKAMHAESGTGAAQAANGQTALGKTLDEVHTKNKALVTSHTGVSKALKDVNEQGKKLNETFSGLGESIAEHMTYPLQQLTWMLEGAAAGLVTFGLVTYSSLQQANMELTMFAGNATAGAKAMQALMALRNPLDIGTLTGSYETLVEGGLSPGSSQSLMRALAGAGAVSGNAKSLVPAAAQAISDMVNKGGLTDYSQMLAIQALFPQAFALAGGDMGESGASLRRGMAYGQTIQMPANFIAQLEQTPQALRGMSMYADTLAGQFDHLKTSVGQMLSVLETPLAKALGGAADDVNRWATGVEGRFSRMDGTLGHDLTSGNIAGFGATLATVLGDKNLGPTIATVTKDMEDMAHIFTGSVVPAVEQVGELVVPALKALSDILDFMAAHKSTTEALILTLVGFKVMSEVAGWFSSATTAVKAFRAAVESEGMTSAVGNLIRGTMGLDAISGAAGAGGASAAAGGGAVAGEGVLAGAGVGGTAIPALTALLSGWGIYTGLDQGRDLPEGYLKASSIPAPSVAQASQYGSLARLGSLANIDAANWAAMGQAAAGATIIHGNLNITIPGAGNPEKVANAVPRNINAQIAHYNAAQSRRTANTS